MVRIGVPVRHFGAVPLGHARQGKLPHRFIGTYAPPTDQLTVLEQVAAADLEPGFGA